MKKLMTMIAAVATAFGLYAADGDTGTSFEGATAGETLASQVNVIKELPDFEATTLTYWANLDDTAVIKDRDVAFANRPEQYSGKVNDYCLNLSTGSKVIERYAKAGGTTTEILNGALYFDSTAKMTVFDSNPEITATDAKLKIWLQETLDAQDNPTATNLMVNGYNCGDYAAIADKWARVTARALKISADQIGFIVYVDGVVVATEDTVAGLPTAYVDDNVAEYGKNGQLFPSLTADTKITGAGFAGMGSVDDLVFTETKPSFVTDYEFYTIAANDHVTTFTANGKTWKTDDAALKFLFEGEEQVEVTAIAYADGYFGDATQTLDVSAAGAYTVGNAKAHNFSVLVDGNPVKCATFADAVTAANGAQESAVISLAQACDAGETAIDNAAIETVLDLAGYTLTGTVTYKTALKVMDSSTDQTGKIVPEAGASIEIPVIAIVGEEWTEENEPTLTLESGTFDGTISTFVNSAVVTGGKFYDTMGEAFPPKGENEWQEGDNTYKATWDETTSYWTVVADTRFTVTVEAALEHSSIASIVVDDVPVEEPEAGAFKAETSVVVTYAADEDYKFVDPSKAVQTFTAKGTSEAPAVVAKNYVAKIGENKYESLAAAVADAKSGDTIELVADCSFNATSASKVPTSTLYFPDGVTFDLAGHTFTVSTGNEKNVGKLFGTAENATVTLTNSVPATGKITMTSVDYGFAVQGGAVLNVACCIEMTTSAEPVFDIYGGTVNCGDAADITGAADIFRFKDDGLTSTVNVTGGKYASTESSDDTRCIFHLYKAHTANINISGGDFTLGNYLIDAYQPADKTAPTLNFTKLDADNAARFSKQVLVSPITGTIIEEKDVLADGCKVVADTEKPGFFKVATIQYATVTITPVDNCTIAVTNGETEVKSGDKFDKDLGTILKVTRTPAEGYKLADGCLAYEEITLVSDTNITAKVEKAGPVAPQWATDAGLAEKYAEWAAGKTIDDPNADVTKDAFLLNCEISAVDTEKAKFKIASIENDGSKWVVKVVNDKGEKTLLGEGDVYANGYVHIFSVKAEKFSTAGEGSDFFQAQLTLKPANND